MCGLLIEKGWITIFIVMILSLGVSALVSYLLSVIFDALSCVILVSLFDGLFCSSSVVGLSKKSITVAYFVGKAELSRLHSSTSPRLSGTAYFLHLHHVTTFHI